MSKMYTLVYFNLRSLGEPIRWILKYNEVSYKEVRIDIRDWPSVKTSYKWRQLPELHIDGETVITQSAAISRYLARKYDLMPSDNLEASRCDEIVDALQDLRTRIKPFLLSKYFVSDGKDAELRKKLLDEDFPLFLPNLNKLVSDTQAKSTEGNFIFGKRLYWADFWLAHFTSIWEEIFGPDLLKEFPVLKSQQEAVTALPQIKNWIETRPQDLI